MKRIETGIGSFRRAFGKIAAELYPVAHGTLSHVNKRCNSPYCNACKNGIGHPSWIFTFSKDGKKRCMHVQERHVEAVRLAIENGKKLEAAILEEGIAFLESLREQN